MKQITIYIPDNKYRFFLELVKNLGFAKLSVKEKLSTEEQRFIHDTKLSLEQVDNHLKGKIELKTADELFDEL